MSARAFATRDAFEIELLIEALEDFRSNLEADEHESDEAVHVYTLTVIDRLLRLLKGEEATPI